MQQKLILILALILSADLHGCSTNAPKPITAGDWSETVHGLRGRLLFTEEAEKFNATRIGAVYLELQNLEDVLNPMEIYYDIDGLAGALNYELLNESKHSIPQGLVEGSVTSPFPFWIMLPYDSTLRFRISAGGYSIPKDAGVFIGVMPGLNVPQSSHGDHFLSASFSVNPPAGSDIHAWRGVLKLPPVKIPISRP